MNINESNREYASGSETSEGESLQEKRSLSEIASKRKSAAHFPDARQLERKLSENASEDLSEGSFFRIESVLSEVFRKTVPHIQLVSATERSRERDFGVISSVTSISQNNKLTCQQMSTPTVHNIVFGSPNRRATQSLISTHSLTLSLSLYLFEYGATYSEFPASTTRIPKRFYERALEAFPELSVALEVWESLRRKCWFSCSGRTTHHYLLSSLIE